MEDPALGDFGLGVGLLETAGIVDDRLPVIAPAAEEFKAIVTLEERTDDNRECVLVIEYIESELVSRVVSNVNKELGNGTVVIDAAVELIDAVSGPTMVPLCVVEIEPRVDGQPPVLELEDCVFSGLTSDEDGVIVRVNRREMVVVMNVVVVEVVGGPLLV